MNRTCPHCGAELPESIAFCPHCAQSINTRVETKPPKPILGKVLHIGLPLLIIGILVFGYWYVNHPKTYDGQGEVYYTDENGIAYQLLIAYSSNRYAPVIESAAECEMNEEYRTVSRLFVNYVNSDADAEAGKAFMQQVENVTMECVRIENSEGLLAVSEPAPADHSPEATLVSLVDFTGRVGVADVCWNLHMKNGDTIVLRHRLNVTPIEAHDYYPNEYPMNTTEELQSLIDEITETINPDAMVRIHLPATTYEGNLTIDGRYLNLLGNTEGEGRTTFTGTIHMLLNNDTHSVCEFSDLNFVGNGEGIAVSAAAGVHFERCHFTNWNTGVLAYGSTWVNLKDCIFENNNIGFHFNSDDIENVSDTTYSGNEFRNNATAILLERVPTNAALNFASSIFSRNGTDIDNRCNQPINIDEAIFE